MIALLQRVREARVAVQGEVVGAIERGLLVFLGVERGDDTVQVDRLLERVLGYRIFPDDHDRMNRSVRDIGGGVLVVSQFTLAADTRKGMRPSFTPAAEPAEGRRLYEYFVAQACVAHTPVAAGKFGADMQVSLVNDGPVTIWLRTEPVS